MVLVHLATGARELDIVANINKKIICASCEQLSLDPHLMSCGNVLCPKCLTSVSIGDNVCPCGTECGHPFSFRNFELQVLNLMVRCPDGCSALVPMRCVDAHLRKCKLSQHHIRCPAYDVDVFKVVDNIADTVSVAIDLGYPLKFETPPSQIHQWTPETPPPAIILKQPERASIPAEILTTLEASLDYQTEIIEGASEANERVKLPLPCQKLSFKQCSIAQVASESNLAVDANAASEDKSKECALCQSEPTRQESDRNSPTEHVTSRTKSHHRKMKENDTLYMDEGVLKLLESGVSGRTRGVQKSGLDSEKYAKRESADARSGRASPTARRLSVSRAKEYSSMYNLKSFRIVIERIPDEIFQKHLSAEGELLGTKQKPEESSQAMKKSRDVGSCTSKNVPALLSSALWKEVKLAHEKHLDATDEAMAVKKTGDSISVAETASANNRQQQHPPKILSSKTKPIPSTGSAAAPNSKQGQTPVPDTVSEVADLKSGAALSSVSSSLEEPKVRKAVEQDQRNIKTATAKGNHAQIAPPPPSPQVSAMQPALQLSGETKKPLPNKNFAGKIVVSQSFEGGTKSVPHKMKRVARKADTNLKTPPVKKSPAPGTQSGSAGKLLANAVVGSGRVVTAKTLLGVRKDETSSSSPMSFKIPRKSTVTVAETPDQSSPAGSGLVGSRVSEDPRSANDQKDSPSNKRAFLPSQCSQPVEVERKRGRIEDRRPSTDMSSHQVPQELRRNPVSIRSDKMFHPCLENSPKQAELRLMPVSTENEPSLESDHPSTMSVPVRIPLEPQVAVKESIPQPSFRRLTERPVLELGLFSKRIWSDQAACDGSRHSANKDERSSLSPPVQPPPPPLSAAFSSSPSMSLLSSSALLAKKQPFDVRCQHLVEPSQLSNPMQQNISPWRDAGSTTLVKTDPRRGCIDPRSGAAAAAAAAVGVQKSASYFPPPAGYGTIIYQRGHLSSSWLGDAVLETSSFWSSHS